MNTLAQRFEFRVGRDYDSAELGPRATLIAFDNENFRQPTATLRPGERLADLNVKLKWFENVRSLKLDCSA